MKKRSVKILSLVLALVMAFSLCPLQAFATGGNQWGWGGSQGPEMPAQQLKATDNATGVSVTVNAPEGALPKGTTLNLQSVNLAAVQNIVDNTDGIGGTIVAAEDITFMYEGTEIEPEKNVSVTLASDAIANTLYPTVLHLDCSAEEIESGSMPIEVMSAGSTANGVSFDADDFSVYAVSGNDDNKYLNVKFYTDPDGEPISQQVINLTRYNNLSAEDKAAKVLVFDPGVPDLTASQSFEGWANSNPFTEEQKGWSVDEINALVKEHYTEYMSGDTQTLSYYAKVYEVRYVVYHDQAGAVLMTQSYHIHSTEPGATEDVKIDWTYVGFMGEQNFAGWVAENKIDVKGDYPLYSDDLNPEYKENSGDVYKNGATYQLSDTLQLYPFLNTGHWLVFDNYLDQDSDATSASYTSPVFYAEGKNTAAPATPTRTGYEFKGWYKPTYDSNGNVNGFGDRFIFGSPISEDTTVVAMWEPKQTTYQVVFWQQNATDAVDAADSAKTYSFYKSEERGSTTGGTVQLIISDSGTAADNRLGYNSADSIGELGFYFTYNQTNSDTDSVVVKGDGSTTLDVYYDRKVITYKFGTGSVNYTSVSNPDWSNHRIYYTRSGSNYYCRFKDGNYYYSEITSSPNNNGNYYILVDGVVYTSTYSSSQGGYRYTNANGETAYYYGNAYTRGNSSSGTIYEGHTVLTSTETTRQGLYGAQMPTSDWPSAGSGNTWSALDEGEGTSYMYPLALTEYVPTLHNGATATEMLFYRTDFSDDVINVEYIGKALNGNDYSQRLATGTTSRPGTWYPTETIQGFTIYGYRFGTSGNWTQCKPETGIAVTSSQTNTLYIAFNRNTYRLDFFSNNKDVTPSGIPDGANLEETPFETDLNAYKNAVPENGPEGTYFDGWYADPALNTPFDFDTEMPAHNVRIYAKWTTERFRVVLDPTGGETGVNPSDITFPGNQATTFRVDYGELVQASSINNAQREGYTLLGWYLDAAHTIPFNFGNPVTDAIADMSYATASAAERQGVDPWTIENGEPKAYDDSDRPNVRGKVVIYAKWRQDPDGVIGINVRYLADDKNENEGTFSDTADIWNDPNIYADQAEAFGQAASAPTREDLQFLYWEILDKSGNPVDKAYPGQLWTVDYNNAVEEPVNSGSTGNSGEAVSAPVSNTAGQPAAQPAGTRKPVPAPLNTGNREVTTLTTTLFSDNFDDGTAFTTSTSSSDTMSTETWTAYNVGNGNNWSNYYGSSYAHSGSRSARYEYSSYYAANCYLISHPFKVSSNASALAVSLQERVYSSSWAETFEVFLIVTDGVTTNGEAVNATHYNVLSSANYTNTTYAEKTGSPANLDALKGKNVRLVIHCTSSADMARLYIDDVNVTETRTGETVTYELANEIEAGKDYIIVVGDTHAVTNTVYANNRYINAASVVNNGDGTVTVFADQESSMLYRVGGSSSGWTFYNQAAGKYLGLNASDSHWLSMISTGWEWLYTGTDLDNQCTDSDNQNSSGNAFRYLSYSTTYDDFTTSVGTGQNVKFYKIVNNGYTVTFVDGCTGETIEEQVVEEGGSAVAPSAPDHTDQGKIFNGWDTPFDNVTTDLTVTATYVDVSELTYTVTFHYKDKDGNWVDVSQTVQHGGTATFPVDANHPDPTAEANWPEGYEFNSWDKKLTNITSNLTINAVYKQVSSTKMVVTLRAVYGKVENGKTFINWYLNDGTNAVYKMEDIRLNTPYDVPTPNDSDIIYVSTLNREDKILAYENHEFLGWARVENPTGSSPYADHSELGAADLYLEWQPDTEKYILHGSDGNVKYTQVAADNDRPYHDMYAVWGTVFYVYHSGTGKVERIVIDATNFEKNADGTNDLTRPTKNTFDLTSLVSKGFLYGGYYKDYAGKSNGFDAKTATGWTTVTNVSNIQTDATLTAVETNASLADMVSDSRISQITDPGTHKTYTGANIGTVTWNWDDSYNADTETTQHVAKAADRQGNAIIPVAGETYFLKEVPADMYLLHYTYYTYKFDNGSTTDGVIKKMWMISDIDDANYQGIGSTYLDAPHTATAVTTLTISTTGTTPSDPKTLKIDEIFSPRHVTSGYLIYSSIDGSALAAAQQDGTIPSVVNYWITPDNMKVTGTDSRALGGITRHSTIKWAETPEESNTVAPYNP